MHDHCVGGRNVDAVFDDVGRQQDIVLAIIESSHAIFELLRAHLAVGADDFHFGHQFLQHVFNILQVFDARADVEGLAAAIMFAQDGFADDHGIERQHEGADGQAVNRRRCNDAHIAHACQRHLQGARDGRSGER